ncbi:OPT oligopeptide transporter protein-domain-containing protein [Flagelloscypha sp. PMI_526]|nr:OPT oligopeptide transporter protein-domain-containing protein [Flagelloscypha sp. PMI_526]
MSATALGPDEKTSSKHSSISREKLDEKDLETGQTVDGVEVLDGVESLQEGKKIIRNAADVAIAVLTTDDDPTLPVVTFRTVFLGIGITTFASVLGTIYTFKPQNADVSQLFCLIIAYVLGTGMHSLMPTHKFFNPGPFNIKEHSAILIMASTGANVAVGIEILAALDLFYDIRLNAGVAMFQVFTTQMIGYGVAGLLRNLLVYPGHAFYPKNISLVNLLQSLHFGGALNAEKRKFFWLVFLAIFLWEPFPQYIFPLLSAFSIVCLADKGKSDFVRNLFGGGSSNEGIGFFSFSSSWTLISQGYPLVWPLQTQVSSYLGMLLGYVVLISTYYANVFDGRDLKFMSTSLFSRLNTKVYNQTAVITSDYKLNHDALETIGLPRYTTTYSVSQLCYNLSLGSAITYVLVWHWKELKTAFGNMRFLQTSADINDPHYNQMKKYKEVPQWVYGGLFVVCLALSIGLSYAGPNGIVLIPAWSIIFLVVFSFVVSVILGFISSTTGFNISIKYAVQMMAGFIHPGQPIPVMYANLFGNSMAFQTLYMLQDLKLGQYVKLPPRYTFASQMIGSIVGSIFNYTMMKTIVDNNRDVLRDPTGTRIWSGWIVQQYNSASIMMGALGKEMFVLGSPSGYWILPFSIFIGLFVPLPFYFIHKWAGAESKIGKIAAYPVIPVLLLYIGYLPYSVNGQWWTCAIIGFTSQWYMRTRYPKWFAKKNYLLSAGLDGGSQVVLFILSFAVFGASGNEVPFPTWWGNADPDILSVDGCKIVS